MAEDQKYYRQSKDEILRSLATGDQGLSDEEAARRLEQFGRNRLTPKKRVTALSVYLAQFKSSLILILLAAAGLIFFIWYFGGREQADLIEGGLILAIVFVITLLGFFQEWKAEKAVDALKRLLAYKAKVVRGGRQKEVDVHELVPGDVVILEEGQRVPADLRLIDVANLLVNEASLTGESVAVEKVIEPLKEDIEPPVADQKNMAFSGTIVVVGRGTGIVVRTGDQTEIGKIASSVAELEEEETPIQQRLNRVGRLLGMTVLAVAAVVFLFIVFFDAEFSALHPLSRVIHSFIAAVALAVAAIPEGLPAVVTISLALGTQRMLRRNSLVRRLGSVETLGSTDVICADKTGTLTRGEMTVREVFVDDQIWEVTGTGYETVGDYKLGGRKVSPAPLTLVLKIGQLCNNARLTEDGGIVGDPTEAALLVSAAKAGISAEARRLREIPFSSERKMMSVLVEEGNERFVMTKGAPEVVLSCCRSTLSGGRALPLTDARKKRILEATQAMSKRALRVLGFAYRRIQSEEDELENNLTFVGLQGMIDPPRKEIKPLITQAKSSGIRTIMITGDHVATAEAIASEIGLTGRAVTGAELVGLSPEKFVALVREVNVYARVNPDFKLRIIDALQQDGHIVAMTGDGVNDAPALKKANIGVAMGITGTDVAKEAADMIILDDNFASIVAAVEEGRGIFDNVRKFVNYLISCNIGEVITVFLGILVFRDILLTATMLLWINIVTDGLPAIALGLDPPEKGILRYSPKRFQGEIIDRRLWAEMGVFGLLLSAAVLAIYGLNIAEGREEARAAAFMAIVIFEFVRLLYIRAGYRISLFSNSSLLGAIALSFLLQLALVAIPFLAALFKITNIDAFDWLYILLSAAWIWVVFDLFRECIFSTKKNAGTAVEGSTVVNA